MKIKNSMNRSHLAGLVTEASQPDSLFSKAVRLWRTKRERTRRARQLQRGTARQEIPARLILLTILATLICLVSCTKSVPVTPPAPPPVNKDWLITASFSYNFTNYMQCSASVTSGCITGFTWGYANAQGVQIPLKTSAVSVCSGSAQPQACTDTANSQLPIGSNIFTIVVNYIDAAGKPQVTAPVTAASPTVIAAGLPSGFTITAQ
jgi:hypothetical protein